MLVNNIFFKQNIWLKFIILITGSTAIVFIQLPSLGLLILLTAMYMLLSPGVYLTILKGLRGFLPFFAGYSLLATLFGVPISTILIFILRLIGLLILVVYFTSTLSKRRLVEDFSPLYKIHFFKYSSFYLLATIFFMKNISNSYRHIRNATQSSDLYKMPFIDKLVESISTNWNHKESVYRMTMQLINRDCKKINFVSLSNVMGCSYLTAIILLLSL